MFHDSYQIQEPDTVMYVLCVPLAKDMMKYQRQRVKKPLSRPVHVVSLFAGFPNPD